MTTIAPRKQYPEDTAIKYRTCYKTCTVHRHRTVETMAKCIWRRALWVKGSGPFASVTYCGRGTTVILCETLDDARVWKRQADHLGCGGRCRGKAGHRLVEVILPGVNR